MDERKFFADRNEFRKWLQENHDNYKGIWVVFSKTSKLKLIKAAEALEEALCFGWIDGQIISISEEQYRKKFTPRRKKSKWSDKNKGLVSKLIEKGLMTEFGMHAIEQAKKDGTWDAPKRKPITDEQVGILINALKGKEPALTNFMKMSPSVKRTYTALYLDAKKEDTRIKRLAKIIDRLNENKKPM